MHCPALGPRQTERAKAALAPERRNPERAEPGGTLRRRSLRPLGGPVPSRSGCDFAGRASACPRGGRSPGRPPGRRPRRRGARSPAPRGGQSLDRGSVVAARARAGCRAASPVDASRVLAHGFEGRRTGTETRSHLAPALRHASSYPRALERAEADTPRRRQAAIKTSNPTTVTVLAQLAPGNPQALTCRKLSVGQTPWSPRLSASRRGTGSRNGGRAKERCALSHPVRSSFALFVSRGSTTLEAGDVVALAELRGADISTVIESGKPLARSWLGCKTQNVRVRSNIIALPASSNTKFSIMLHASTG